MAGRFSVESVFKAVDRVTAPVSRMQNRVGKFTRSVDRGFRRMDKSVGKFTSSMKAGAAVIAASVIVIATAFGSVAGVGAEFEQTLVNAAVKFPGAIRKGTPAFKELEDAARKTGKTTEFMASAGAGALNFYATAGFSAKSAIALLPGTVDLATAASIDLATAADIATDTLGAFGFKSKEAAQQAKDLGRVNDVLAKTSVSTNTSIEQLFEAISEGGAIAKTAGADVETFSALTGLLGNAAIKSGRAGTTLKNLFLSLSAPSAIGAKVLRRLGVAVKDSKGDFLDVADVLESLNKGLTGLGTADRSGALDAIFGKIPLGGVNILLGVGAARIKEYREELRNATGTAKQMAAVMRDTVQGRLNSLKSSIEAVKLSIFGLNKGPMADAIDQMTAWVRTHEQVIATNIGGFLAKIIKNFTGIVTWAKRVAIGLAVFFTLTTILKGFILVMSAVNLVMALNPVGLIVIGIVALIAAIVMAVIWWDNLKAAIVGLPTPVKIAIAAVAGPIGWFIGAAAAIRSNWEPLKSFFSDLWRAIVLSTVFWTDKFKDVIGTTISSAVIEAAKAATGFNKFVLMAALIQKSWEPLKTFFADLWGGIVGVFEMSMEPLKIFFEDLWKGIIDIFITSVIKMENALNGLRAFSAFIFRGDDEEEEQQKGAKSQMVSPQDRTARSIEERRTTETNRAEITLKSEAGQSAEVTRGSLGAGLKLLPTGAF